MNDISTFLVSWRKKELMYGWQNPGRVVTLIRKEEWDKFSASVRRPSRTPGII